jgi:hypothetical protein
MQPADAEVSCLPRKFGHIEQCELVILNEANQDPCLPVKDYPKVHVQVSSPRTYRYAEPGVFIFAGTLRHANQATGSRNFYRVDPQRGGDAIVWIHDFHSTTFSVIGSTFGTPFRALNSSSGVTR